MALQKNKIYRAEISGYTAEGAAVTHIEGMVVFVPGGAAGDQCDIKIVKVQKHLAYGRIEQIVRPSRARIEPACPYAAKCGGCCFQYITYEEELSAKRQRVEETLRRIGGVEGITEGITGSEQVAGYRNKAQFPVGQDETGVYTGFYRPRSHDIIRAENCMLLPAVSNRLAALVCRWMEENQIAAYNEATRKGLIRHIYVRVGFSSGESHLCLIATRGKLPAQERLIALLTEQEPSLTGIVLNVNKRTDNVILGDKTLTLWGSPVLQDSLCGNVFQLSPHAFYQVNHAQAERLYEKALAYAQLTGKETVIDLYCGAGTITLALAAQAARVIGVEIVAEAVENAKANAAYNGVQNVEFMCADAGQAAMLLAQRGERPDVLTVDPPRKGLSAEAIEAIAQMAPQRVVYVSCDPATLARDVKMFTERGYTAEKAHVFDLFPRTSHVETVVSLVRKTPNDYIHVKLDLDDLDLTAAEAKATYSEIKEYVLEKFGLKVSSLYIAQIKEKYGIIERENYNLPKTEGNRVPKCPKEKEDAIVDALKHFKMI